MARPKGGLAALAGEARAFGGALLCIACALVAYGIRYAFVEPEAMGAACARTYPWWCPIRTGFIVFTKWDGFGWLAVVLAAAADREADAAADVDGRVRDLEAAPQGMTIDPVTGSIRWTIGNGDGGEHNVTIRVRDGHGGKASQEFKLFVSI